MSDAFVGEIRIFGFNFPPRGWAQCNGQLLAISQNTALFSLLGTQFGGDGRVTFGLPDLRDSAPLHQGQGTGLSPYSVGDQTGSGIVTLQTSELPAHSHGMVADSAAATSTGAAGNMPALGGHVPITGPPALAVSSYTNVAPDTSTSMASLAGGGGGQPHNNLMPYLVLNYCIALQGIFPSRQ